MFRYKGTVALCIAVLSWLPAAGNAAAPQEHPCLLVKKSRYEELGARARKSPWREMKQGAIETAKQEIPRRQWNTCHVMRDVVSAATLAYILNPPERPQYRKIVLNAIDTLGSVPMGGPNFSRQVPPGTALVNLMLALDVMHDDFAPNELTAAEARMDSYVSRIDRGWEWNKYTVHAVWALYRGDDETFQKNKTSYDLHMASHITGDGVWCEGVNYAAHRFAGRRDSKYLLMDICEFMDKGDYYDNPRIVRFYEWLYGYGYTPMHTTFTFGDTQPNSRPHNAGAAPFHIYRFSDRAAGYAAYRMPKARPMPLFHTYVLMAPTLPPPLKPTSRIFRDGGAVFFEDDQTPMSLAGTLWNCTKRGWHTHSDVNAVHLCAYGENILQNTGYVGAGSGRLGFDWDYISMQARANNTVLIDGVNHRIGPVLGNKGDWYTGLRDMKRNPPDTKRGAGINEGFTSAKLDYACGDSGKVLANGAHQRSFVFVHPQDGLNGYFVLFDEVRADNPKSMVNLALHPNSHEPERGKGYTTIQNNAVYDWTINGNVRFHRENEVKVRIGLGRQPAKVEFPLGLLSAWGGDRWQTIGRYLYATFETDERGRANLASVIYPYDRRHQPATITQLTSSRFGGVELTTADGMKDYAIAVSPLANEAVKHGEALFQGRSILYRSSPRGVTMFFSRKATKFLDGASGIGFSSRRPVSIHLRGKTGCVVSPGTQVVWYYPGAAAIRLNGQRVEAQAQDDGGVETTVPAGTHAVEIVAKQ